MRKYLAPRRLRVMELWDSIEFGARALMLKSATSKSREEINRLSCSRLEQLVAHAQKNSAFWREKFSGIPKKGFEIPDLPTSTKPELMDNFDRAVTVDDVRRNEVESFMDDETNLG